MIGKGKNHIDDKLQYMISKRTDVKQRKKIGRFVTFN